MRSRQAVSRNGALDDERSWRSSSTGDPKRRSYHSIKRDANGYPIFVRASGGAPSGLAVSEADTDGKDAGESEIGQASQGSRTTVPNSNDDGQESLAKLYARLISAKRPRPERDERSIAAVPTKQPRPVHFKTQRPSKNDWFIRRAVAQQQINRRHNLTKEPERALHSDHVEVPFEQLRCSACGIDIRSKVDLDAHQSSIAHLLASDTIEVPKGEETALGEASQPTRTNEAASRTRRTKSLVVLKCSNVGYKALEKMGWRSGMGLGRSEWASVSEAEPIASTVNDSGAALIAAVETSSSSSTSGKQPPPHLPQSSRDAHPVADASVECRAAPDTGHDEPNALPAARPLLEPIPVHVRPDRRGIGSALPSSAKVRDRYRVNRSQESATSNKQSGQPTVHYAGSSQGARRKDIKAKAEQDRAQRMAIRASLDW